MIHNLIEELINRAHKHVPTGISGLCQLYNMWAVSSISVPGHRTMLDKLTLDLTVRIWRVL